jgi:uncharacterized RDD family membrane protein YckC
MSEGDLDGLIEAGPVPLKTLVWREGMAVWEPWREGVALNVGPMARHYAGFWIRFGASFVDGMILNVVNVLLSLFLGVSLTQNLGRAQASSNLASVMVTLLSMGLALAYDVICVGTWGATPGKMACKLRIVTAQGEKLSYIHALARCISKLISLFTCLIGFIIAAFDAEKRALHDRICGTRVLRQSTQG